MSKLEITKTSEKAKDYTSHNIEEMKGTKKTTILKKTLPFRNREAKKRQRIKHRRNQQNSKRKYLRENKH